MCHSRDYQAGREYLARGTYINAEILKSPPIAIRQTHYLGLETLFRRIPCYRFCAGACHGFVIRADPTCNAVIGHLAGHVSIDGGYELVVEVLCVCSRRREEPVDFR